MRQLSDFTEIGDAWIFVGIERHTKLVLALELGNRTVKSATRFMHKIASATDPNQKFQLTTDGLQAYSTAVGNVLRHQGERVDYPQLIKIYVLTFPKIPDATVLRVWLRRFPTPIYWGTRRNQNLHKSHRATEFDDAYLHADAYSPNKRVLQEVG